MCIKKVMSNKATRLQDGFPIHTKYEVRTYSINIVILLKNLFKKISPSWAPFWLHGTWSNVEDESSPQTVYR